MIKNIIISPDSFKHACSSIQAALALEKGLRQGLGTSKKPFKFKILIRPLSDGGEGFLEVCQHYFEKKLKLVAISCRTLYGKNKKINFGILNQDTAIIESAKIIGLPKLPRAELEANLCKANSKGIGECILKAKSLGCKKIIIALGGTGSIDVGLGALKILEQAHQKNPHLKLSQLEVMILHDVSNPLNGTQGAVQYAFQKGLKPKDKSLLIQKLNQTTQYLEKKYGKKISSIPGLGAAGGLAAGLYAFFKKAELKTGSQWLFEKTTWQNNIHAQDLVITGEGNLDPQTLAGKLPWQILNLAKARDAYAIAVAGRITNPRQLLNAGLGRFQALFELSDPNSSNNPKALAAALKATPKRLEAAGQMIAKMLLLQKS
ncbi:MAG: glycerate kinase [Gammaproteobacteria bacterium]